MRKETLGAIWLIALNLYPASIKGMLKGIIKALGIQRKAVLVHIICNWFILMSLIYLFAFRWKLGLVGMFMAQGSL